MADMGRLVGYLDDRVPAPHGGQAVYQLPDGRYVLGDGKGIRRDVLQQLLVRGLLVSAEASHARTIADMQPFVPERIDPKADSGVVYIRDRTSAVARVDYEAGRPYEGDLVFRSNMDAYFVTEKGYVLNLKTMEELGEAGWLLVPKSTRPMDPYAHDSSRNVIVSSSDRFSRRQHWAKLGFVALALVLITVIAYGVQSGLFGIGLDARDAFRGNQLEEVTESSKDLGSATAEKSEDAAEALDGAGRTQPESVPAGTPAGFVASGDIPREASRFATSMAAEANPAVAGQAGTTEVSLISYAELVSLKVRVGGPEGETVDVGEWLASEPLQGQSYAIAVRYEFPAGSGRYVALVSLLDGATTGSLLLPEGW